MGITILPSSGYFLNTFLFPNNVKRRHKMRFALDTTETSPFLNVTRLTAFATQNCFEPIKGWRHRGHIELYIEARAIRSKIAEGEEWKVLAFTSWTGHRWSKKKNKNHETVLSRFFPEQKTKRSFLLRHLCPVSLSLRTIDLRRRYTDTSFSYKGAFGQEKIQINVFLTRTLLFKNPRTIQSLLAKDIRVWK